jgi:UDP-GlcNAc:undecaprenyl-phosphate GlcNAc-1-phosphate transferase
MHSYLAAFCVALVAGLLFTPLVLRGAVRWGVLARQGDRHVHSRSVPRLGGLALMGGWVVSMLGLGSLDPSVSAQVAAMSGQVIGVVGGAVALCLVGAVDDLRGLRPLHKLGAQVAASLFAYHFGFRIDAVSLPFFGVLSMGVFAVPVTVAWIVGVTNAMNLIDGLDGLAAGVSFFAALTGFVVALLNGSPFAALVYAPLMGVLLGFLVFNFNPARIFMGDSGSYFLGYVLATTSLAGSVQQKASTAVSLLVPMIALGLPIFDTLFSMVRRMIEHRPIFSPDRGHVHHRLLEMGLTHRRAVVLLYGVSVTLAACALIIALDRSWVTGGALLAASVVLIGLVRFAGYFEYLHRAYRQTARIYDPTTERLRRALPHLLASFRRITSEDEAFETLHEVAQAAGFAGLELRSGGETVWRLPESTGPLGPTHVHVTYPVGPDALARSSVYVSWGSDYQQTSQQVGILLQVLVDSLADALERSESALAPADPVTVASTEGSAAAVAMASSSRA